MEEFEVERNKMNKFAEIENDLKILETIFSLESYRNNLTPEQKGELNKGLEEILKLLNGKDGKN